MTILRHLTLPVAVAVLLGLVVAWEAVPATSPLPPPDPVRTPTVPRSGAAPPSPVLLAVILDRPLFAAGRRPPDRGRPGSVLPRLAGTVVAGNGMRVAILALPGRDRPLVLREGDTGLGLSVLAVGPGRVVARDQASEVVLTLRGAARTEPTPAAAPAPDMTKDPRIRDPNNQDE